MIKSSLKNIEIFNSTTEVGMRILFVMDAFHPRKLDLQLLAIYDYFIVHTGDIDGPASLHARISSRSGEYLIRRQAIQNAISFLRRNHLCKMDFDESGQVYEITENGSALIDIVSTDYHYKLKERASWLEMKSKSKHNDNFEKYLINLLSVLNASLSLQNDTW